MPWFRRKARENEQAPPEAAAPTKSDTETPEVSSDERSESPPGTSPKPRRRGTRGGRGRKKPAAATAEAAAEATPATGVTPKAPRQPRRKVAATAADAPAGEEEKPKTVRRRRTPTPRRPPLPAVRKEMLISHDVGEQRVAVLEDSRPVEVYLGRPGRRTIAGNVYKGVVDNILPGMEASFVDIGLEKNGFLYVDEIVAPELEGKRHGRRIQDLIKRGEEVLVQAVKDPMGTKGARLTTEISLPGRFIVYVPFGEGIGVSRRLEDNERDRLKALCKELELTEGGIIVRTAAEGASQEELAGDLAFLRKLWSTIQGRAERLSAPSLVYQEAELALRVVRDLFIRDFERLAVDHERTYRRIVSYLKRTSPELAKKVEWYRDREPLMERFGVDAAVRSTLDRRVDLPSGGYLVFDYAEAFTVIDVNTGRFVGARGRTSTARLEDTITKNNLEAATEIVRQLRLRDIGGIIVIDFIDMANPKNRQEVEEALKRELERDRTKTYVVEISPLGLVEMTRQNVTDGPREILTSRCPACGGDGIVLSDETHAVAAERRLRQLAASSSAEAILVELPPHVAGILIGPAGVRLAEIEKETGKRFAFETRDDLPLDHFAVLAEGSIEEIEPRALPVSAGQELELKLDEVHLRHPEDAIARLDGYVIAVGGAAGSVGKRVRIRIERATRTVAYASIADAELVEAPIEAGSVAEEVDGEAEVAEDAAAEGHPWRQPGRKKAEPAVEVVAADVEEVVARFGRRRGAGLPVRTARRRRAEEAPDPSGHPWRPRPEEAGASGRGRGERSAAGRVRPGASRCERRRCAGRERGDGRASVRPGDAEAQDPPRHTRGQRPEEAGGGWVIQRRGASRGADGSRRSGGRARRRRAGR